MSDFRLNSDFLAIDEPWQRTSVAGTFLYQTRTMLNIPSLCHGFTTRRGGGSEAPYESMNLGLGVGDSIENVIENRRRAAKAVGFSLEKIVTAGQVHGAKVAVADFPGLVPDTDALVTDVPGVLLMLMFADCVPIFLYDPENQAVGLVHSGWRGTDQNIVSSTVNKMSDVYGSQPGKCLAAIGPCIGFEQYEVSEDVAGRFRNLSDNNTDVGGSQIVLSNSALLGTYQVNLREVVRRQLVTCGFRVELISVSEQCTYKNRTDFFSHRRDASKGGTTGRMAGVIGLASSNKTKGNC